jgi:hypothetical protein
MAAKILALAVSEPLRQQIADQCCKASTTCFDMKRYVAQLEALFQAAAERTIQEKVEAQMILSSCLFQREFSCPFYLKGKTIETAVRHYVRRWASGVDRRKPFPGFHPGIYLELHGLITEGADPFADYLRAGKPEGPWLYPVIRPAKTNEKDLPADRRVALHLHVYYPELLSEIVSRLSLNRIRPDLFVSISDKSAHQPVVRQLKEYAGKIVDIQLVPNRGRDIGPLFTAFAPMILSHYDFIGHIHTKKSPHIEDATVSQSWYRFLLENLLGGKSPFPMADRILAEMKADASIGMIFPDDPKIVGWTTNRAIAEKLAERIGIRSLPVHFIFPIGTMFWARTSALAPWMNLKLDWDDYPEEPLPEDGTLLHAIERLFSLSLPLENLRCAVTNVAGLAR